MGWNDHLSVKEMRKNELREAEECYMTNEKYGYPVPDWETMTDDEKLKWYEHELVCDAPIDPTD